MNNEEKIIECLNRIVSNTDKLVDAIPKSTSMSRRVLEIFITFVTLTGLLGAIDIIKNWIGD
ncbi:MAG: hypothetical protein Ta2B_04070 [Termitinemataceae bacterium]|nr:MAG: hypothetical protein Ta2B_04070 [Termitinemataceae bacterium]